MRIVSLTLLLVVSLVCGSPAHAYTPRPSYQFPVTRTVQTPNGARTYVVYIPYNTPPSAKPVLLAFHPAFGNALGFAATTRFSSTPETLAASMVLVFPQGMPGLGGLGNTWNIDNGLCCDGANPNVDEFAFVAAILADLSTLTTIDMTRIYATGYSTGGQLAYDIACRDPGVLAAIAPVSAPMDTPTNQCTNTAPMPVFNVQGLQDPVVPYNGGQGSDPNAPPNPPIPSTIAYWAGIDSATKLSTGVSYYSGQVTCDLYNAPALANPAIQACVIPSMGHRWPGEQETAASQQMDQMVEALMGNLGPYAPTLNLNSQLVDFLLAQHR